MNICKHKKLLAYQLLKQFESGFRVDDTIYSMSPRTLRVYCEKCKAWQTIEDF